MSCPSWHDAILERVAGDLSGPPADAVDRHLAVCPACRLVAEGWQRLAVEAEAAASHPAPAAARALAKVYAQRPAEDPRRSVRQPWQRLALWARAFAAPQGQRLAWASAGLVAILGFWLLGRQASGPDPLPGAESRQARSDASPPAQDTAGGRLPDAAGEAGDARAAAGRSTGQPADAIDTRSGAQATASPPLAGRVRSTSPRPPAPIAQVLRPAGADTDPTRLDHAGASDRAPASATDAAPPEDDEGDEGGDKHEQERRRTATPRPIPIYPTDSPRASDVPKRTDTPGPPRRAGLARVAGRVLDPAGLPVPLALVYLRPAHGDAAWRLALTDTDGGGGFSIDLPPGRWSLWVEAEGRPPVPYVDEPILELTSDSRREGLVLRLPPMALPPTASPPSSPTAPLQPTSAPISSPTPVPPSPSPTALLDTLPPSPTGRPAAVATRPAPSDAAPKEPAP